MAVLGFRLCHRSSRISYRKLFSTITLSEEEGIAPDISRRALLLRQSEADLADEIIRLRMENRQSQLKLENMRRELDDIKNGCPRPWIDDSQIIRTRGPKRLDPKLKIHTDLLHLLGQAKVKNGAVLYSSEGNSEDFDLALINLGLHFLEERGFPEFWTPRSLRGEYCMGKSAFRVIGKGVVHGIPKGICPSQLPIRYTEFSSRLCFDAFADVGLSSHGVLGILTNYRTQKLEQVCITGPNRDESSKMYEELLKNCEEFYGALGISYRVAKGSEALADGAERYHVEGWFPASQTYRGLASCILYTDCQLFETQSGERSNKHPVQRVHLLKSTFMVTEGTIAGVLENYQREYGVEVPELLRMYMGGKSFLPFRFKSVPYRGCVPQKSPVLN